MTKKQLEQYAEKHLNPNYDVDRIDAFCAKLDVEKALTFVKGDVVLEMGAGSGYYTEACIKTFGHSYIVDASSKLLSEAKNKY
ncbi:MAG: class I SAM-dependent methyltransferase [Ignavibacteria bacterium]